MRTGFIKSGEIVGTGKMNRRDNTAVLLVIIQSATHCDGGLFTRHGEGFLADEVKSQAPE
jgi:hypothetical protein